MTFAFVKINFVIKLTNLFCSIFLYRKTSTSSNWTDDDNFSSLIKLPAQVGTLTKWKRKLVELKLVENHFSSNQNSPTTIFARIETHWELFVNIDFRYRYNLELNQIKTNVVPQVLLGSATNWLNNIKSKVFYQPILDHWHLP